MTLVSYTELYAIGCALSTFGEVYYDGGAANIYPVGIAYSFQGPHGALCGQNYSGVIQFTGTFLQQTEP
jgi:hypothetical protein